MHVTDYDGNEYILQATSTNDGDLNGNQSVSMLIESNKVNDLFINEIDKLWTVTDLDNVEHKIIYLNKKGVGDKLTVNIKGIPLFFHKFDSDRIYEEYNEHMTAQLAFTRIFKDTGFTFALVDSFGAVQWEGFGGGETKLETFKRAINRYGAEFEIVGNIVYIKKLIGNDVNHMYRHRLNASNIVQEIDAGEMWTYAKGYADYGDGEGGEDWKNAKLTSEYTSPLAKILGVLHAPPIKNGNIKDKNTLDQQLKTLVEESLKISVTADIHDLRKQGYPIVQSKLGDRVFLIDERIDLDDEVRVVNRSITRNWQGAVLDLKLTFGTESITKRHMSNINTAVKEINDLIKGNIKLPFSVLDNMVIAATNALKSAQTELIFENGIIAVDKNNPNHLVLFNSNGLGISRDGGNTFEDAITYLGVNTKLLTAGQIFTNHIEVIGEADYFFWDGNGLQAISKTDARKYVKLTSDGLYIARGAIQIERPDGAVLINNGVPRFGLAIQSRPFYVAPVEFNGQYYEQNTNEYKNAEIIYMAHEGRYLNINVGAKIPWDASYNALNIYVEILEFGNIEGTPIQQQIRIQGNKDESTWGLLRVDLGVPTYSSKNFYLRFRTDSTLSTRTAMVRFGRMWLNG